MSTRVGVPTMRANRGLLAIAIVLALGVTAQAEDQSASVHLDLEARLFHKGSGTFSDDVLKPGGPDLVNVVAGKDPSTSTLVTAVVSSPADVVLPSTARVRLTAVERTERRGRTRTLLDRTVAVGSVAKGGVTHLGFWLDGTGCRPIELRASITVPGRAGPISATTSIPFACGE
jgi:hypothetical protein